MVAVGDPVTVVFPLATVEPATTHTTYMRAVYHEAFDTAYGVYSIDYAGRSWILGHHTPESREAQALLAAWLLLRGDP